MNELSLDALKRRVERLEKENRWCKRGVLGVFMLLAAFIMMGQVRPAERVVEAEKFVLKDPFGNIRGILGAQWAWDPPTTSLGVGMYGLHFYDGDGKYRAGLHATEATKVSRSWALKIEDRDTPTRASLELTKGNVALVLTATNQSRDGAERELKEWQKKLDAAKTPEERAKVSDYRSNEVRAALIANAKGGSLLVNHGLGGGLGFSLSNQQPTLYLEDEKGTGRVVLGYTKLEYRATGVREERPASSIVLFDKDGKVNWKAP